MDTMNFTFTGIVREHSSRRVAYYYDEGIGDFHYGAGHVMKPLRIKLTHHLLMSFGIYRFLEAYRPTPATVEDMCSFHADDYIDFLKNVNPNTAKAQLLKKYNCYDDCPVFDGLFDFCQMSCGGSIAAAIKLNKKQTDIAINWMGGLHHAKKKTASGFCYTNDIVLAILELLKYHQRILYVDIDVHHGDGVEEAFLTTDRVMTVSFHKFGNFFPGTGHYSDTGMGQGKYYAINVPLLDGCSNAAFHTVFKPVMTEVMERFQPSVVVLQCGADSLCGDRLGAFNLNPEGHGECVSFFRKHNLPLLLVGGGGYTPRNVARCWAYETSLALNQEVGNVIPDHEFSESYAPTYLLHFDPLHDAEDLNTPKYLFSIRDKVLKNLAKLPFVPSVQMQPMGDDSIHHVNDRSLAIDLSHPDIRLPRAVLDSMIEHEGDYYDGEQEGDDRKNEHNAKRLGVVLYSQVSAKKLKQVQLATVASLPMCKSDKLNELSEDIKAQSTKILDQHFVRPEITRKRKSRKPKNVRPSNAVVVPQQLMVLSDIEENVNDMLTLNQKVGSSCPDIMSIHSMEEAKKCIEKCSY